MNAELIAERDAFRQAFELLEVEVVDYLLGFQLPDTQLAVALRRSRRAIEGLR